MNAFRESSSLNPLKCLANSIISSRLSSTRCYSPRGRHGAGRYAEEELSGKKGRQGAGRHTKRAQQTDEEEKPIFSEEQLAHLKVGRDGHLFPSYTGKVSLPRTRSLYTVLRSPHVHKKSREQFETRVHRQLLFIKAEPHELEKKFFWLQRQRIIGVQHEVIAYYQTRLGDWRKILNKPDSEERPQAVSPATTT
uniref:Ribosomal protein S10 n=1 Tax=California macrophylla TaxID=337344 RepID=A0A0G2YMR4_9ROSI|nr:ribosomal protein S10 [California macrophylla]